MHQNDPDILILSQSVHKCLWDIHKTSRGAYSHLSLVVSMNPCNDPQILRLSLSCSWHRLSQTTQSWFKKLPFHYTHKYITTYFILTGYFDSVSSSPWPAFVSLPKLIVTGWIPRWSSWYQKEDNKRRSRCQRKKIHHYCITVSLSFDLNIGLI